MKKILAVLMAVLMVASLAACGGNTSAPATEPAPAPAAANTTAPAAETTAPEQSLIDAAKAEGELVVYGSCEEDYLAAACAHFEELYDIKVQYQRLSTGEVQAKIEEENGNPSADAWFGGTTDPYNVVAAESADYNMPMVTASATAEAVTYDAETDTVNANVFRATFTDPFQGIKMADYAYQKLGYTKAAVIFKKGADYNEGLAENFVNEFESLGGIIVDQESYSEGDVDFKTQLTTILGKDPETVFCPNYYEEVGQILSQAESVGLTVPFLGGDGWDGLEGYATNDQLKDTYFCANYAKGSNSEFEDAYKAEYGQEYPNGFSPLGYDAAKTVVYGLQAAEDAGLEAGTDDYKQAVIDAIASGTIDGITGTFTFDEHHDPVKQTAILTYVDGKPVLKEMF